MLFTAIFNANSSSWRKLEKDGKWDEDCRNKLIEDINTSTNVGNVKNPRVLIFGPIQGGKSSLINSVATIDKGRIARFAIAEGCISTCTQQLLFYQPTGFLKNFTLLDVMGFEAYKGLHEDYSTPLMKGRILPGFKFNKDYSLSEEDKKMFIDESESIEDSVHCNVFVLNAKELKNDTLEDELLKRINAVRAFAKDCDVVTLIVLTNIDEVDKYVEKDVSYAYKSDVIKELVHKAERIFGIQQVNIFPIRNYTREIDLQRNMDILILLAIKAMVECTIDRIEKVETHKKISEKMKLSRH